MTTTTADLAEDLDLSQGAVDVLLEQLDEHHHKLPDKFASFLREVLDPHGERTSPFALWTPPWQQARAVTWRRVSGVSPSGFAHSVGPDPPGRERQHPQL